MTRGSITTLISETTEDRFDEADSLDEAIPDRAGLGEGGPSPGIRFQSSITGE